MHFFKRGAPLVIVAAVLGIAPAVAAATPIHVTSLADSGGGCTLRGAITAANTNSAAGTCPAGQAGPTVDVIDFPGVSSASTVTLASALPTVSGPLTIAGPGASLLAIDGANSFRPFNIGSGVVTVSGLTITNGRCDATCGSEAGAAFVASGTLTLDFDVVSNNTASAATVGAPNNFAEAGAIEVQGGSTLNVTNSTITGNTVTASGATPQGMNTGQNGASGGAIMNRGTTNIDQSTISGNTATATVTAGASGNINGGAIDNDGHLTITRSTLSGNQVVGAGPVASSLSGGAITEFNNPAAIFLLIEDSTVANNTITGAGTGGGIYSLGAPGTVRSSTITGNSATVGANFALGQPITISNSIISNPQVGANCSAATMVSAGFNLESANTCGLSQPTDLRNTAPMLTALANNGGPTKTMAPQAASPVIDHGKAAAGELTDQRGLIRPSDIDATANASGGDGSDIGAVEVQDTVAPDTSITSGPAEGSVIGGSPSFGFSSSESVSSFQCSLDGGAFAACANPDALSGLPDGSHAFAVRAVDGTGNADPTPSARSFKVDATSPQTTLGKVKKKTSKPKVKVTLKSSEPGSSFECRVDKKAFKPCTSPYKTKKLKPGKHKIQVRAIDSAGNADPSPAVAKVKIVSKR